MARSTNTKRYSPTGTVAGSTGPFAARLGNATDLFRQGKWSIVLITLLGRSPTLFERESVHIASRAHNDLVCKQKSIVS